MNRDFRSVTLARFFFSFGVQIQAVVMGWQVYDLKRDPLYLGFIGLTEAVPALSLALWAGVVVDRGNPLRIYRAVVATSLLSAALLLSVSLGWLGGTDDSRVAWIYGAAFLTGVARGFSGPSLYSMVPQLIARERVSVSAAWITSAMHVASVSGPALGGVLYAWRGAPIAYGVDCAMLVSSLVALAFVCHRFKKREPEPGSGLLERLTSGVRYVFGHQLLLSALALDMFAVLFGGATALFPVFARDILAVGPTGLGFLRAATPLGAIVMSAFLIRFPIRGGGGRALLGVVAGYGVCMIGFALSRELWLSFAFLAASGAFDGVSMVIRSAIVQLSSPEEMRGRIAAVNSMFIGSSNELGAFESGVAAKLLGAVPAVVFGGCVTLLTVAIAALRAPRLRTLDLARLEAGR